MYQVNVSSVEVNRKYFQNEYLNIEILVSCCCLHNNDDLALNFDACIHFDLLEE